MLFHLQEAAMPWTLQIVNISRISETNIYPGFAHRVFWNQRISIFEHCHSSKDHSDYDWSFRLDQPQSEILIKTDNFNAKDKAVVVKSVALEIAQIETKSMIFESDHQLQLTTSSIQKGGFIFWKEVDPAFTCHMFASHRWRWAEY